MRQRIGTDTTIPLMGSLVERGTLSTERPVRFRLVCRGLVRREAVRIREVLLVSKMARGSRATGPLTHGDWFGGIRAYLLDTESRESGKAGADGANWQGPA